MRISIFAESIKRLYIDGKVSKEKILELKKDSKLTIEETNYILDAQQGL